MYQSRNRKRMNKHAARHGGRGRRSIEACKMATMPWGDSVDAGDVICRDCSSDLLYCRRIYEHVGFARRSERKSQAVSCSHNVASEGAPSCAPSCVEASDATAIACPSWGSDASAACGG